MTEPHWPNVTYPPIDYQDIIYYSAPKHGEAARQPRRGRSRSCSRPTRSSASRSREQKLLAGVAVDAIFDSRLGGHHLQGQARRSRAIIFCSFSEAVREHPELVQKYLGSVVPASDNFFAALNSAVFTDGSFVYIPKGVALPDGAVHLLPHQRRGHRPVRADADRGRRGRHVSYLEGCTAPKRDDEPAARRGGGAGGARGRHHQVLHGAELVRRRRETAWAASTTSSPSAARRMARGQDLLDPGRDRLGHHLEVSQRHPAGRRLGRRVLLGGGGQRPAAGRHRHQDDPHRAEHPEHHRLQGHLAPGRGKTATAAWSRCCRRPTARATTPSATRC